MKTLAETSVSRRRRQASPPEGPACASAAQAGDEVPERPVVLDVALETGRGAHAESSDLAAARERQDRVELGPLADAPEPLVRFVPDAEIVSLEAASQASRIVSKKRKSPGLAWVRSSSRIVVKSQVRTRLALLNPDTARTTPATLRAWSAKPACCPRGRR